VPKGNLEVKTLNERFGEPKDFVRKKVKPQMDAMVRDFITQAPFAVLATSSADGDCDASPRGGTPGFFKVLDEKRLVIPDIAGNKLFQSFENVQSNPHAGLIFIIPGCDWTVRANGRARLLDPQDDLIDGLSAETLWEDDNTKVLQGLLLEVDEAYAHCPRAFLFSKLWDREKLAANIESDSNRYWFNRWREEST
jgi:PPOX class probable FMN-dependent enzyme